MRILGFSYSEVLGSLADPLARAARPDFLTGRFVADAQAEAERRLAPVGRRPRALVYDAENFDFVELTPDGMRVLQALERAGDLDGLCRTIDPDAPDAARAFENLSGFARELHRLGVLAPRAQADLIQPAPRGAAPRTTPTEKEQTHAG